MKKWSYVAAAMLTVASGVALTSCIDNDEPFGIEQIRLATANLLEAKKAAVEAEAAAKSAQVEIAKINAEIEKLRIENEKIMAEANAKIAEANAKKIEAEAQAELLRAEGQKAVNDAEAAKLLAEADIAQAEADYWKAQAESFRTDAQIRYDEAQQRIAEAKQNAEIAQKNAEIELAKALYYFEKDKADNLNVWNQNLWNDVSAAFQVYLYTVTAYNGANEEYLKALNHMAELEADLVWLEEGEELEGEEGFVAPKPGFYSPKYRKKEALDQLIAEEKAKIDLYDQELAILNNYKDQLTQLEATYDAEKQKFEETKWYKLLSQYDADTEEAKDALQAAKLAFDELQLKHGEDLAKPGILLSQLNAFKAANIAIPALTINPMPEVLAGLGGIWANPLQVIKGGQNYTLNDQSNYNAQQTNISTTVRALQLAKLDENDVLWTEARLAEMERQLAASSWGKTKALWENARDVYNKGGVPQKDLLPNEAAVEAAIAAYNALAPKAKPIIDEYNAKEQEVTKKALAAQDALDDFNDNTNAAAVWAQAQIDYTDAIAAANDAYRNACDENQLTYQDAVKNANVKAYDLYLTSRADYTAWRQLQLTSTSNSQINQAYQKYVNSYNAFWNYYYGGGMSDELVEAQQAIDKANSAAQADYYQALYDAEAAKKAAYEAYIAAGGYKDEDHIDASKDPAYAAVVAANEALAAAIEAFGPAQKAKADFFGDGNKPGEVATLYNKMTGEVDKQLKAMGYMDNKTQWYEGSIPSMYTEEAYDKFALASIPVMYLDNNQVYKKAKDYVGYESGKAFGNLLTDVDLKQYDKDWFADNIVLIEDATTDNLLSVVNDYITKSLLAAGWNENQINQFVIAQSYGDCGVFGKDAELMVKIAYAKMVIANKDNSEIDKWITTLNDASATMAATKAAKQAEANNLQAEYNKANAVANAITSDAESAVKQANALLGLYQQITDNPDVIVNNGQTVTVPSLREWVESLADDALGGIENQKNNLNNKIIAAQNTLKNMERAYALAQTELERYEYQLGQYESEDYAKVENPYKYRVECLQAEVESLADQMALYKQHYEDLLQQYNDAKKSVNYPD